jgi:hypothetical protein
LKSAVFSRLQPLLYFIGIFTSDLPLWLRYIGMDIAKKARHTGCEARPESHGAPRASRIAARERSGKRSRVFSISFRDTYKGVCFEKNPIYAAFRAVAADDGPGHGIGP